MATQQDGSQKTANEEKAEENKTGEKTLHQGTDPTPACGGKPSDKPLKQGTYHTPTSCIIQRTKFCPTCTVDPFEIKTYFVFFRKIKLKRIFGGTETQGLNSSVFKKRSKFNAICSNPSIQTFCRIVETFWRTIKGLLVTQTSL